MANRDNTGPMGMGQKTGRGLGICGESAVSAGYGRGRFLGRGRGACRFAAFTAEPIDKKEYLEEAEKEISAELEYVRKLKEDASN